VNHELLIAALDALDDGLIVCSPAGTVLFANRAARLALHVVPGQSRRDDVLEAAGAVPVREQPVGGGVVLMLGRPASVIPLAEGERAAIEGALRESGWQLSLAARRLGISRTTLWRRLKGYGLTRPGAETARL
jgi:transcriptional regulator of acetoin/glycerol metabolism